MPEINCIALIGVVHDGRPGLAVRVGGGLSTAPRLARDLGAFVPVPEAIEVLRAIVSVWNEDRRYRLSRVKARMKFMVDDYGAEAIRTKVEERLGRKLDDVVAPAPDGYADHIGFHEPQKNGLFHVGVSVPAGTVHDDQLQVVADLVQAGDFDVR